MAADALQDGRFLVEFLKPEDYEEVHDLQVHVFLESNLECVNTGVSKWAWDVFSRWLNSGWEKAGLTQIVRDTEKDNLVVAFLFCKDLHIAEPFLDHDVHEALLKDSPGFGAVFAHGEGCVGSARAVPRLGPTLVIETGGTRPGYEGLGLGSHLRFRLLGLARERGYRRITVETHNMATRHIYSGKLGFEILEESRHVDFQAADGSYPFREKYVMPDDFLLSWQHKILQDVSLDEKALQEAGPADRLTLTGAGTADVNGLYIRLPGSRGPHESTCDAWRHSSRRDIFLANQDCGIMRKDPGDNRWVVYRPQGACYSIGTPGENASAPPAGTWEVAHWAAEAHMGQPGQAPAPEVIYGEPPPSCSAA